MDPELRQELEALERRLGGKITEEVQGSESRMREYVESVVGGARTDLRAEMRAGDEETRRQMGVLTEDLRAEMRVGDEETRRHMGVLVEGLRADFRIVTEALVPTVRRVGALEERGARTEQRVELLEGRVSALERPAKPRRPRRR